MKSINSLIAFLVFFLSFSVEALGQKATIDSLENELLYHIKSDTVKVDLLNSASYYYKSFDIIEAEKKALEANRLAKKLNYKRGEAKSLSRLGRIYLKKTELGKAENSIVEALNLFVEINDQDGINSSKLDLAEINYRNNDLE